MMLNSDDTAIEQYMNAMHRSTDVMINCEKCSRLYYTNLNIAQKKHSAKIPLLCTRCINHKEH